MELSYLCSIFLRISHGLLPSRIEFAMNGDKFKLGELLSIISSLTKNLN